MIRLATPEDSAAVVDLVIAAGMFAPEEAGFVQDMLAAYFAEHETVHVCVVDDDGGVVVVGVAYYQPKAAADRVWDLTMIAVDPDRQGQGRGTQLLRHAEQDLRSRGQRLLLVDTSGTPQYDRTREFYRRCGYDDEARIRDYWTDGDDLVVFRRALTTT